MKAMIELFQKYGFGVDIGDYSVAMIDNPCTMFQEDGSAKIVESLRIVVAESFGVPAEKKSIDGIRDHVANVDVLAVMYDDEKIFGFASARIMPEHDLFYLHGAAVLQKIQGKGISLSVVKFLIEKSKMSRIAFTTQNPAMFCLCKRVFGLVYPRPEIVAVPRRMEVLGAELMKGRKGEFSPETFVAKDLYSSCLYDRIPDCKDVTVNEWFKNRLNIENGMSRNAFLFVGENYNNDKGS